MSWSTETLEEHFCIIFICNMETTSFLLSPPTEVLTNLIKFSIPRISAPRSQSIPLNNWVWLLPKGGDWWVYKCLNKLTGSKFNKPGSNKIHPSDGGQHSIITSPTPREIVWVRLILSTHSWVVFPGLFPHKDGGSWQNVAYD